MREGDFPQQEPRAGVLERAAESWLAKLAFRVGTPLVLGFICWSVNDKLTTIQTTQVAQAERQRQQAEDMTQVKSDVRVLYIRLDERVIRQVDRNTSDIRELQREVGELKRVVPAI